MKTKPYIKFIIVLLIAFNTATHASLFALEKNAQAVIALSITAAVLLQSSRVRTWLASFFPSFCFIRTIVGDNIVISKIPLLPVRTITINGQNVNNVDVRKLPIIKPSGTIEKVTLGKPIKIVSLPAMVAKVYITDAQEPHILIDQAFAQHITLDVNSKGELIFTTTDNKPFTFMLTENPWCIIYAKLATSTLEAKNGADVTINNQLLINIQCSKHSRIQGSVNQTNTLTIEASNRSRVALQNINTHTLTTDSSNNAMIRTTGSTINQIINASNNAVYDGSRLITQNGTINASVSNNAQAFTTGSATNQTINASNNAAYYGKNVVAQNTTANVSNSATASVHIINKLKGNTSNIGFIFYSGKRQANVSYSNNAMYLHGSIIPFLHNIFGKALLCLR